MTSSMPVAGAWRGSMWMELTGLAALVTIPSAAMNVVFVYEALFGPDAHLMPAMSLPATFILLMFMRWTYGQHDRSSPTSS